jgi:hypothetical protein
LVVSGINAWERNGHRCAALCTDAALSPCYETGFAGNLAAQAPVFFVIDPGRPDSKPNGGFRHTAYLKKNTCLLHVDEASQLHVAHRRRQACRARRWNFFAQSTTEFAA